MARFSSDRFRLVDSFDSSYWSGKDVQVFADDVIIDDAFQVTFQVMEQVRAYYHYSHYESTRMHHGTRVITGELSVNFKRSGYLYSLLSYLRQNDAQTQASRYFPEPQKEPSGYSPEFRKRLSGYFPKFQQERPTVPFVEEAWGPPDLSRLRDVNATELRRILDEKDKLTAENTRWVEQGELSKRYAPTVQTSSGVFETRFGGFDLNIIYGASVDGGQALRYYDDDDYTLGHSAAAIAYQSQVGTGVKIIGVELMGSSTMIDESGRPLTETYAFQAKSFQVLKVSELRHKE